MLSAKAIIWHNVVTQTTTDPTHKRSMAWHHTHLAYENSNLPTEYKKVIIPSSQTKHCPPLQGEGPLRKYKEAIQGFLKGHFDDVLLSAKHTAPLCTRMQALGFSVWFIDQSPGARISAWHVVGTQYIFLNREMDE